MENSKLSKRSNMRPGPKAVGPHLWLVSFGDLLTLLLCFFLSIITFGPLGNRSTKKLDSPTSSTNQPSDEGTPSTNTPTNESGTTLAIHDSGSMKIELMMTEVDFEKTPFDISKESWSRLKNEIPSEGYSSRTVVVETCSKLSGSASAKARFISMSRALAIRSHLIDAGFDSNVLKLRSVGEFCSVLRGRSIDDDTVVARVTFRTTEEGRGGGGEHTRAG